METITEIYHNLLTLSIYRRVITCPVTSRLTALLRAAAQGEQDTAASAWGELIGYLSERGDTTGLLSAVLGEIRTDENPFSLAAAAGIARTPEVDELAARDLSLLYRAASVELAVPVRAVPKLNMRPAEKPFDRPWEQCLSHLADFHCTHGVGLFVDDYALVWENEELHPVSHPDPIRLSDLKEYAYQHGVADENTRAFLQGASCNNILLYGDRGTGKSSTVKALLNEYAHKGLRMIELHKRDLNDLPRLTEYLAAIPMRFILFIDDLSFVGGENDFAALKAVLEGGLAARPDNVLMYATSNRRHLLRESFSDRGHDDVHHADTVQEAVSLSDRFGICLTFLIPDKQRFLRIVEQIASDEGIDMPVTKLLAEAERWAMERGARSPRFARQFITDLKAKMI